MRFRFPPLALFCALLALLISVAPACAGNYVVTNTFDDTNITDGSLCSLQPDACTLRGALYAASENPDADTILMGNSAFVQNLNGPLPVIKTDVTLSSGVGTKLQSNGFYRLLRVERGATLRLSGFQMVNGQTLDFGGAINSSGTLIVSNCLFRDNRVGNISSGGGAVSNFGGSATLINCEFNNNFIRANGSSSSVGDGGAVVSDGGTLEINRCLFVGNSAGALGIASGGAVAMRGGALSIFNSEFRGNSAQNGGGAVSVNDASATLSGVTFRDNSTTNRDAAEAVGGALYFADNGARTLSLSNGTFVGNSANSGGAVANYGASNALSLNYCTLVGNTARARGGAIEFAQGGGQISNSIVAGNLAPAAPNISGSLAASSNFNLVAASVAATGLQTDGSGAAILKDNGGPIAGRLRDGNAYADYSEQSVATVALTVSSPAVDAGGTVIATDARRVVRPQGGASDQGAFELTGDDIPYSNATTKSFIVTTIADSFVSGQTTLRDAILASNLKSGADTITFAPGVSGTINLSKVLPDLSSLTLVGPGKDVVSVRPATAGAFRIFNVPSSATVALSGLTLTVGQSDSGGALLNDGNTTLSACRLTGNAALNGGAVYNSGFLSLNNCLLGINNATSGGAIYNGGVLTLATCQLTANTAQGGGALFNVGKLTMTDSLFNANIANGTSGNKTGGGAWLDQTVILGINGVPTTISAANCTFSGNSTAARGGAIRFYTAIPSPNTQRVITLDSLTITRNRGDIGGLANDNQISATGFTLRNSVVAASTSDGAAGLSYVGPTTGTNNFLNGDPKLGPLQSNGGSLETIAPLAGSPLINAGTNTLATDARGVARPQFKFADIGAVEISAADGIINNSLVVTTTTDEDNGTSDPVYGTGTSLREALERSNSDGKDSVITFSSSVFATRQTIILALNELVLGADGKLTLDAPTAGLAISAGGRSRVLNIASGADVALSGLQITGGVSSQFGQGAGVYNAGTLNLRNATINGNSTSGKGAGIYNAGTATLSNVTVTGNINYIYSDALSGGGGAYNLGTLNLVNCTVADNSSGLHGGAINNAGGTVTLRNTLFAQNNQDDTDLIGVPNPGSGGDANGNFRFARIGDAGLSAVADNGGQVPTMALSRTSPVSDKGIDTTTAPNNLTTDARGAGYARKVNARVDVGAYELQDLKESPSLVVNTTQDADDAYDFVTSLREAMNFANSDGEDSTILFDETLFATRQTLALNNEISITGDGKLFFTSPEAGLVLSRPGATFTYTVRVYSGADAYLSDLTFSNGGVSIRNEGTLDLKRCAIVNNRNLGLSNGNSGVATLSDCTIAGNRNTAMFNGGSLTASNCTLVGNYAGFSNTGRAMLTHCTLAGNTNYGITSPPNTGTITLKNTLVAGNSPNLETTFVDGGGNITEGSAADAGLEVDADGVLVLKDNGGPTSTVALVSATGTAVNRGVNANAAGLSFDQRGDGYTRVQGGRADIGAFESSFLTNTAPVVNPSINSPKVPGPTDLVITDPHGSDADGDPLTYTFVYKINGTTIAGETDKPNRVDLSKYTVAVGDTFTATFTANDGKVNSAPVTLTRIIAAAPVANAFSGSAPSGTETALGPITGSDPNGLALRYVLLSQPTNGSAFLAGNANNVQLYYTSRPRFGGTDTMTFQVVNSEGRRSAPATISVTVEGNRAPTASNGSVTVTAGVRVEIPLVANDPDGDELRYRIVAAPTKGSAFLANNSNGGVSLFYTANRNASGADSVQFTVTDPAGATSAPATISITVAGNSAPVANATSLDAASGERASVLLSGSDADGDELVRYRITTQPAHGSAFLAGSGDNVRLYYTSNAGYRGADSVQFTVTDSTGRTSAPATVSITVSGASSGQVS